MSRNNKGQWLPGTSGNLEGRRAKVASSGIEALVLKQTNLRKLVRRLVARAESGDAASFQTVVEIILKHQNGRAGSAESIQELKRLSVPQLRVLKGLIAMSRGGETSPNELASDAIRVALELLRAERPGGRVEREVEQLLRTLEMERRTDSRLKN